MSLTPLKNLGPKSARMRSSIGIHSRDDLERLGILEAFRRSHIAGRQVASGMLYAMDGALRGMHWNEIGLDRKLELRRAAKEIKGELETPEVGS